MDFRQRTIFGQAIKDVKKNKGDGQVDSQANSGRKEFLSEQDDESPKKNSLKIASNQRKTIQNIIKLPFKYPQLQSDLLEAAEKQKQEQKSRNSNNTNTITAISRWEKKPQRVVNMPKHITNVGRTFDQIRTKKSEFVQSEQSVDSKNSSSISVDSRVQRVGAKGDGKGNALTPKNQEESSATDQGADSHSNNGNGKGTLEKQPYQIIHKTIKKLQLKDSKPFSSKKDIISILTLRQGEANSNDGHRLEVKKVPQAKSSLSILGLQNKASNDKQNSTKLLQRLKIVRRD